MADCLHIRCEPYRECQLACPDPEPWPDVVQAADNWSNGSTMVVATAEFGMPAGQGPE